MLDDDDSLCLCKFLDDAHNAHAFVNVEVGRRLVKEVDIYISENRCTDGHALQFSPRELLDGTLEKMVNAQRARSRFKQASFVHLAEQVVHGAFDAFWEFIHVLRLEGNTDASLLDGDEEIPEFAFWKGFNHVIPVRFLVEPVAQIGRHAAR